MVFAPAGKSGVVVGRGWRPPCAVPPRLFRPKGALLYISKVERPPCSRGDRILLFLTQSLEEPEKGRFNELMHHHHDEWFGCACWGSLGRDTTVRISLKLNDNLLLARPKVAKAADGVLKEIFAARK